MEEFKITLGNKFALLNEENEDSVGRLNADLTTTITESALAVGEAACRTKTAKLNKKTEELIAKRENMKGSSSVDQVELAELSEP